MIPGLGRSPGEGKGYLLQYSGVENSIEFSYKESDTTEWLSHFISLYFIHCSGLRCVLQKICSGSIPQCLNVTLLGNRVFMEVGELQ